MLKYTGEWRDYVTRQARWVDFDNDYRTMNPDYMESVMWAFKQLHDKGLVYEGFRVLPYCWNDETPLSNHELRMDDDVYQMRQDPAVTVGYDVTTDGDRSRASRCSSGRRPRGRCRPTSRSWSATDIDYVVVESDGPTGSAERYLHRRGPAGGVRPRARATSPTVVWRGTRAPTWSAATYAPPFSYYAGHERAFRVVPGRVRHHHGRHRAGAHRRRLR